MGLRKGVGVTSVGLPRMHTEAGERRDFLPEFVRWLHVAGASSIVLEEGYGSGLEIDPNAYLDAAPTATFAEHHDAMRQDLVVVLRCPTDDELLRLRPGTVLFSMLHLPTRPDRAETLGDLEVRGVSLDGIVDDHGHRLIENLEIVGWVGVREAFKVIAEHHADFAHPSRRPLHVTCLGAGGVAGHAVRAATRYGDPELREELVSRKVPGVETTVVDFDLTWHEDYMLSRFESTDLVIDATQRADQTGAVVPNRWLAALPEDAVLLDLSADPYDLGVDPPKIKGIEGIPHGNLDQWRFATNDPAWDELDGIDTRNRRVTLSCYSWPGLRPRESMASYGAQLEPVLELALATSIDRWDPDGASRLERALVRADSARWARRGVPPP